MLLNNNKDKDNDNDDDDNNNDFIPVYPIVNWLFIRKS